MENIDILRKQIEFIKLAGDEITPKQKKWLEDAEKKIFWDQVQFDTAERILGKKPKNQNEASEVVRKYNQSQIGLSR